MRMTLYIFDMGGVVSRNADVFSDVFNYLNITEKEFLTFAGENLEKLMNGKVSTDEFWAKFSRAYGREVKEELFGKFLVEQYQKGHYVILILDEARTYPWRHSRKSGCFRTWMRGIKPFFRSSWWGSRSSRRCSRGLS
jgi:hypothetical protein